MKNILVMAAIGIATSAQATEVLVLEFMDGSSLEMSPMECPIEQHKGTTAGLAHYTTADKHAVQGCWDTVKHDGNKVVWISGSNKELLNLNDTITINRVSK